MIRRGFVLGLDVSTRTTGYAVLCAHASRVLELGFIDTRSPSGSAPSPSLIGRRVADALAEIKARRLHTSTPSQHHQASPCTVVYSVSPLGSDPGAPDDADPEFQSNGEWTVALESYMRAWSGPGFQTASLFKLAEANTIAAYEAERVLPASRVARVFPTTARALYGLNNPPTKGKGKGKGKGTVSTGAARAGITASAASAPVQAGVVVGEATASGKAPPTSRELVKERVITFARLCIPRDASGVDWPTGPEAADVADALVIALAGQLAARIAGLAESQPRWRAWLAARGLPARGAAADFDAARAVPTQSLPPSSSSSSAPSWTTESLAAEVSSAEAFVAAAVTDAAAARPTTKVALTAAKRLVAEVPFPFAPAPLPARAATAAKVPRGTAATARKEAALLAVLWGEYLVDCEKLARETLPFAQEARAVVDPSPGKIFV